MTSCRNALFSSSNSSPSYVVIIGIIKLLFNFNFFLVSISRRYWSLYLINFKTTWRDSCCNVSSSSFSSSWCSSSSSCWLSSSTLLLSSSISSSAIIWSFLAVDGSSLTPFAVWLKNKALFRLFIRCKGIGLVGFKLLLGGEIVVGDWMAKALWSIAKYTTLVADLCSGGPSFNSYLSCKYSFNNKARFDFAQAMSRHFLPFASTAYANSRARWPYKSKTNLTAETILWCSCCIALDHSKLCSVGGYSSPLFILIGKLFFNNSYIINSFTCFLYLRINMISKAVRPFESLNFAVSIFCLIIINNLSLFNFISYNALWIGNAFNLFRCFLLLIASVL